MSEPSRRLRRSLEKNLADLSNGILTRRAYNAFSALRSGHSLDYFRVAFHAMHDEIYACAHRVFDSHQDAASIWYIRRVEPKAFSRAAKAAQVDPAELESLATKLLPIRNRIQFHTDKRYVEKPKRVWLDAAVTGNEIIRLTEGGHEVLRGMYRDLFGEDRQVPEYHGEDIERIVHAYKAAYPKTPLRLRPPQRADVNVSLFTRSRAGE